MCSSRVPLPEQGEEERQWPQDLQPSPLPLLGPHEDLQEEKPVGDERPATEPLFKVLDTPLSEGDEPTTLPAQGDHGHSVQMEGYLGRKHDLEGPNKKASNRCVGKRLAGTSPRASATWVLGGRVPSASGLESSWAQLWASPGDTWHDGDSISAVLVPSSNPRTLCTSYSVIVSLLICELGMMTACLVGIDAMPGTEQELRKHYCCYSNNR